MAVRPFVVRPLAAGDAGTVLGLARALPRWFNRQGLEQIAKDLTVHQGWVAVRDRGLIGFVTWHPVDARVANLSWMGVVEAEQHRGVGTVLLDALVDDLRRRGFESLEVSTVADTVEYAPYADTRRFYRARGFVDVGVDRGFYGEGEDDRYDRLRMRRDLVRT